MQMRSSLDGDLVAGQARVPRLRVSLSLAS